MRKLKKLKRNKKLLLILIPVILVILIVSTILIVNVKEENELKQIKNSYTKYVKIKNDAKIYSVSSSEAEKQATTIERDFDSLYETIYMQQFIGQDFDGIVSSVTSFGMFVKLDNTVEGLVPFNNILIDDFFEYDENLKILIGRKIELQK